MCVSYDRVIVVFSKLSPIFNTIGVSMTNVYKKLWSWPRPAAAKRAAVAATQSVKGNWIRQTTSTKSAFFSHRQAQMLILSVWQHYGKDPYTCRHFCERVRGFFRFLFNQKKKTAVTLSSRPPDSIARNSNFTSRKTLPSNIRSKSHVSGHLMNVAPIFTRLLALFTLHQLQREKSYSAAAKSSTAFSS